MPQGLTPEPVLRHCGTTESHALLQSANRSEFFCHLIIAASFQDI
jgi:hypothetical protein